MIIIFFLLNLRNLRQTRFLVWKMLTLLVLNLQSALLWCLLRLVPLQGAVVIFLHLV